MKPFITWQRVAAVAVLGGLVALFAFTDMTDLANDAFQLMAHLIYGVE